MLVTFIHIYGTRRCYPKYSEAKPNNIQLDSGESFAQLGLRSGCCGVADIDFAVPFFRNFVSSRICSGAQHLKPCWEHGGTQTQDELHQFKKVELGRGPRITTG